MNIDLNAASNFFGPLSGEVRVRLMAAINDPGQATWDDAHCIILSFTPMLTLWQAVIAVDPTFPQSAHLQDDNTFAWPRTPSPDVIVQAIQYATR